MPVLATVCFAVAAGPFALLDGVDVPDDAVYATISTWEAAARAVRSGHWPFFLTSKLGGVSIYSEAQQMGPIYPGMWLGFVLPIRVALPLAFALHCLGCLLAVRWLARTFGVQGDTATLAGAAVAAGPVGLAAFVECQTDSWPFLVWLPLVLGCTERCRLATDGLLRLRWAARAGLALGMLLLGSHLRLGAAACGVAALFALLQGPRLLPWLAGAGALGVLMGSPGWLPAVLELGEGRAADGAMASMAVPPLQPLRWGALASWLAPRTLVVAREFSTGTLLGGTFLVGALAMRGPLRRMALLVPILLLASTWLPGLRWLLLPLSWLAHPTLILYYSLAIIPAAVVGAAGLERLLSSEPIRPAARGACLVLVAALLAAGLVRPLLGLMPPQERVVLAIAAVQAVLVAGTAVLLLACSRRGPRLRAALLALAFLDLVAIGLRYHLSVPSRRLEPARAQMAAAGGYLVSSGYLHVGEMAALLEDGWDLVVPIQTGLRRSAEDDGLHGEVEDLWAESPAIQGNLLGRRWPPDLAAARGVRSLSARVKVPPMRQVRALLPLAEALSLPGPGGAAGAPGSGFVPSSARLADLFAPGGVGWHTLALHGVPVAVSEDGSVFRVDPVAPRCYSPRRFEVVPRADDRLALLLYRPFDPDGPALLEGPLPPPLPAGVAGVDCEDGGLRIGVDADVPALVVLRERFHPGWRARDLATNRRLRVVPVNQVHLGVTVPAGRRFLSFSFVPPGLVPSALLALPALLAGAAAGWPRRQRAPRC